MKKTEAELGLISTGWLQPPFVTQSQKETFFGPECEKCSQWKGIPVTQDKFCFFH